LQSATAQRDGEKGERQGYHRDDAGAREVQKASNAAESWLGQQVSSHFLLLLLPQQDVRWEAPYVETHPETQMILP